MEFLRKHRKLSNQTALLAVFFAWYIPATLLSFIQYGSIYERFAQTVLVFAYVLLFLTIVFAVSRFLKRTDLIDAAWGPSFVVAAIASFYLNSYEVILGWNTQTLVTILVIVWAARLAYYISRRLLQHPEDKRYVELRKKWKGNEAVNAYIRIFVVQALLATVIATAVVHINVSTPQAINWVVWLGLAIWLIGFVFESVGDAQLRSHLAKPSNKGTLMTSGLWKYTRHPNYFGEATMWWGIFVIALSTEMGWIGIVTPFVITYLLLFVSGVSMTEKAFEKRKGWSAYKKRTSIFIPLPPRQ